jgi:ankyrin repeat protein
MGNMFSQSKGKQLLDACLDGNFPVVRSLVGSGASVNFQDNGVTPVIYCCVCGHPEILQYLLEQGASAGLASNRDGYTPLHCAAVNNQPECMTVLLRHGVALNAVDTDGFTALWLASLQGYLPIVELLVEGGADFDIAANDSRTPLAIAKQCGNAAVAKYLSNESKWRRVRAWAMVRSSVRDEEALTPMMKVLLCDDVAREIQSYL